MSIHPFFKMMVKPEPTCAISADELAKLLAADVDDGAEWFNEKYPNAKCIRCSKAVDGRTVVYCGDACETWYCADCRDDGNEDCPCCFPKSDETYVCEECNEEVCDEDYVGCCRDGECPYKTEALCRACGTWDEDASVWRCKACSLRCEGCGVWSDDVGDCDGRLLCDECIDAYNQSYVYPVGYKSEWERREEKLKKEEEKLKARIPREVWIEVEVGTDEVARHKCVQ